MTSFEVVSDFCTSLLDVDSTLGAVLNDCSSFWNPAPPSKISLSFVFMLFLPFGVVDTSPGNADRVSAMGTDVLLPSFSYNRTSGGRHMCMLAVTKTQLISDHTLHQQLNSRDKFIGPPSSLQVLP